MMRVFLPMAGPRPTSTLGLLLLTWVTSAFGNSLQSISILAWLQPLVLLLAYDRALRSFRSAAVAYTAIIAVQALGTTFGMCGVLAYPRTTFASLLTAFATGILLAAAHTFGALLPAARIRHATLHLPPATTNSFTSPTSDPTPALSLLGRALLPLSLWAYPVLASGVRTVVGLALAHDLEPGVAVADWPAVAQLASLVGLWGINFLVDLAAAAAFVIATEDDDGATQPSAAAAAAVAPSGSRRRLRRPLRRHVSAVGFLLLLAAAVGGGLVHRGAFYQVPVERQVARQQQLAASCVVGQGLLPASEGYLWMWQKTAERVAAGDHFILWAEEAVSVSGDAEEQALLAAGRELLAAHGSAAAPGGTYLGLAYQKFGGDLPAGRSTNHFTLLGPNGTTVWNYRKAFPVPFVEAGVVAGPARLPLAPSPYGLLAGGICFDLDRPQYVRAAGAAGADLLLQPSWTWGALGPRHFAANALRAVESGLTLLRCSSSGVSGVVSPRGVALHWLPTGARQLLTMSLPLEPHLPTLYARAYGWALEWVCLGFAALLWAAAALPPARVGAWLRPRGAWAGADAERGTDDSAPLLGSDG